MEAGYTYDNAGNRTKQDQLPEQCDGYPIQLLIKVHKNSTYV